jgi:hypothetical protein
MCVHMLLPCGGSFANTGSGAAKCAHTGMPCRPRCTVAQAMLMLAHNTQARALRATARRAPVAASKPAAAPKPSTGAGAEAHWSAVAGAGSAAS